MSEEFKPTSHSSWLVVWEFIIHVMVGSAIFVIIAGFSVLMNYIRLWLNLEGFVSNALQVVEVIFLAIDALLFIIFILRSSFTFASKIIAEQTGILRK